MINSVICLWLIQGVLAAFQGRMLYQYSLMSGPFDMKRIILTMLLLYAAQAVSMTVLLIVFHGKELLRFTNHAFWVTVIFPAIATLMTDIIYIRMTGRFIRGLAYLLLAAAVYLVAGIGLPLLLVKVYGHRAFRPRFFLKRSRKRYGVTGSPKPTHGKPLSQSDQTGKSSSRADQAGKTYTRTYKTGKNSARAYHTGKTSSPAYQAGETFSYTYQGGGTSSYTYREGESSSQTVQAGETSSPTSHTEQGYPETGQSDPYHAGRNTAAGSVIIPDYRQEYIDMVLPKETGLSTVQPTHDRAIFYGGSSNQVMVAYINKDNMILQCEEGRYGYQRLGRIASTGKLYENTGRTEKLMGNITPAGYVKNAAGLEVGYVDEEGYVYRYEGIGVRDMTHAKTLIGRVNPGDLEAGAALILFY